MIRTAEPPEASPLVRRLAANVILTEQETSFLEGLQSNRIALDPGEDLVRDGEELRAAFVIRSGWTLRHRITQAGRRQILNVQLPGDVIGLQVNYDRQAISSVTALTPVEVAAVDPLRILDVYRDFPVLAAGLDWLTVHNFNILSEHNISLGARSARERILHFLLELWSRLSQIGEADETGFANPLTQQQIADAMGLSQVHTNKTLRRLEEEGLIRTERRRLFFPDLEAALEAADFDGRFLAQFRPRMPLGNDPGRWLRDARSSR